MVLLRSKCLIVGDACVGKSAITQMFYSEGEHFPEKYTMTTGIEYCVKLIQIPDSSDSVELHLFDSAGQDVFYDLAKQMWSDASCVIYVFDVCNEASFAAVESWVQKTKLASGERDDIPAVLIANKIDLEKLRKVSTDQGQTLANKYKMKYYEVSAKKSQSAELEEPFLTLAAGFHKKYEATMETFAPSRPQDT